MRVEIVHDCAVHRQGTGPIVVCLPAFGDGTASWRPLAHALSSQFEVAVVELPGLNRAGALPVDPDLAGLASLIAEVVQGTWTSPVTIVGHSAGSALAVRAAHLLNGQCQAIVSVEGNLTAQDAFLTGLASNYDDPAEFKADLIERVGRLHAAGQAPASFLDSLAAANAHTLWVLGRDIVRLSADNGLGHEFVHAPCPTLLLWSKATTHQASQDFLQRQKIIHRELGLTHHWPWIADTNVVAATISDFVLAGHVHGGPAA